MLLSKELKKRAPAIVVSAEASSWGSCRIITPNLEESYRRLYGDNCNFFSFTVNMTEPEIILTAAQILDSKPTRIVFIDHIPHPKPMLLVFWQLSKKQEIPPIDVHVYGDYTLYTPQWMSLEKILKKFKMHYFCASHRQRNLISSFMKNGKELTTVCPFPISRKDYSFNAEERDQARKSLEISSDETLLLYTGRISMQKNVLRLCREVYKFIRENPNTKFILAGNFDDLAAPFFGVNAFPGSYRLRWESWHKSLPSEIQNKIMYVGNKNAQELRSLYLAADAYISLSTHHDEDFGMSPIEALACGCPVVLSSWGGYASFALREDSCLLTPIRPSNRGLLISSRSFQKNLKIALRDQNNMQLKSERSQYYLERFSIEYVVELLRKHAESNKNLKLSKFTPRLYKHAKEFSQYYGRGYLFKGKPNSRTFYYQIYRHYLNG